MANFSTKAWGSISDSDYKDAGAYCSACLIDMNGSGDKTKDKCKLPYKEPGGAPNKNGIHAAAAALAGARGGLKGVSAELKRRAAKKLISLYKQMGEQAPDSTYRIAGENAPKAKD